MPEFLDAVDIANRALQHCGVTRINRTYGFTQDTKEAAETAFAYGKARVAELRRNTWRCSIRVATLRPIATTDMLLAPALWSSGTTYSIGSIVTDAAGTMWASSVASNLNQSPGNSAYWELYCGPLMVMAYDSTQTYYAGELAYVAVGDGTYSVYQSLINSNSDNPATVTTYDSTATYMKGDIVTYSAIRYQSLVDLNIGQQPDTHASQWTITTTRANSSNNWLNLDGGAALQNLVFTYPLGSGPVDQASSRNVYRVPANYLRPAHQDPRAGSTSYLGAPSGLAYTDWEYQGNYIVSRDVQPIVFRFVTDLTYVPDMDPMFCEGLAARIALMVCKSLTQSDAKTSEIASEYQRFMSEARLVNAIEIGPEEPPEDDYLTCRG